MICSLSLPVHQGENKIKEMFENTEPAPEEP